MSKSFDFCKATAQNAYRSRINNKEEVLLCMLYTEF